LKFILFSQQPTHGGKNLSEFSFSSYSQPETFLTNQRPIEPKKNFKSAPHFATLDSLRGIAALSVVLFHVNLSWINIVAEQNYVRNSYLMVDVFFVLSGFVVFYAYERRIKTLGDTVHFMWLRFWRLYPLHFAFLLVYLFIECLIYFLYRRYGLGHGHAFTYNNLYSFMGNLVLVQSLHIFDQLTFNHPAWSISVEFYTYVVFAFLVLLVSSRRVLLVGAALISALSFGALVWLGPMAVTLTYDFGIVRCLTGFFLGVLIFALYDTLRAEALKFNSEFLGWCALAAMIGFIVFLAVKRQGFSDLAIYPLSAAVILLVALAPRSWSTRFLRTAPLVWLGTVSYSVYMVHASVIWGVSEIIRYETHAKEIILPLHDTPTLVPSAAVGWCALVATLGLTLLISHFTYLWIEKPFRDWSKTAWRARSQTHLSTSERHP
jgi:peptidoglycan/LPS O-acetylase OafA/YrhL